MSEIADEVGGSVATLYRRMPTLNALRVRQLAE